MSRKTPSSIRLLAGLAIFTTIARICISVGGTVRTVSIVAAVTAIAVIVPVAGLLAFRGGKQPVNGEAKTPDFPRTSN